MANSYTYDITHIAEAGKRKHRANLSAAGRREIHRVEAKPRYSEGWSDERVELLLDMRRAGRSPGEIGRALNVTPHMVVSKLARLAAGGVRPIWQPSLNGPYSLRAYREGRVYVWVNYFWIVALSMLWAPACVMFLEGEAGRGKRE